ncbi:LysR family transcriptional regulator [Oceanobacillus piezotolerans]|uniref:LysR family transcriptional regulator n=1 Tax=Oceanobacillus piezotolerans TaxID=2448030 RepID=A0A498D734_9BACI|nr:LysR family transcriptional regulator [Oceanobacillus piezotolerans]RLL43588.1 LysR family transcriptional regulator [Oceanobacillus piezotolerans]
MSLKQLRYFLTVARLEHMSEAAAELEISQSSLSKTIGRLEQDIGVPLFDRKGKTILLNEYGQLFYQKVEKILSDLQDAKEAVQELANIREDSITINVMNSKLLPKLFYEFYKKRPNVKFRQYLLPDRLAQQKLLDGEIDLLIVPNPITDERIEWAPLFKEEIFLVVPKNHPLAAKKEISLVEAKEELFILSETGQSFRTTENRIFEKAGFTPRIAFEGEDLSVILQLVNEGAGISFIFNNLSLDSSLDNVKIVKISNPACFQTVGIAWNKKKKNSFVVESFRTFSISFLQDATTYGAEDNVTVLRN